jgi:hypothetical protein
VRNSSRSTASTGQDRRTLLVPFGVRAQAISLFRRPIAKCTGGRKVLWTSGPASPVICDHDRQQRRGLPAESQWRAASHDVPFRKNTHARRETCIPKHWANLGRLTSSMTIMDVSPSLSTSSFGVLHFSSLSSCSSFVIYRVSSYAGPRIHTALPFNSLPRGH